MTLYIALFFLFNRKLCISLILSLLFFSGEYHLPGAQVKKRALLFKIYFLKLQVCLAYNSHIVSDKKPEMSSASSSRQSVPKMKPAVAAELTND